MTWTIFLAAGVVCGLLVIAVLLVADGVTGGRVLSDRDADPVDEAECWLAYLRTGDEVDLDALADARARAWEAERRASRWLT